MAVFYLRYLRSELLRRRARTILTVLGLAIGVALVVVISALTRGLDRAQKTALDPLASIGTDLTVTRSAQQDAGAPGLFGAGGGRDVFQSNRSVLTDLSKLGKPGQHFVHDFFLPGNQLTFPQQQVSQIRSLDGVAGVSSGLTLIAEHQEGIVPKIVAQFRTGGQRITVDRRPAPPTAAELAKMQACFTKARAANPDNGSGGSGSGSGRNGNGGFGAPGGGERGGGFVFGFGGGAFRACLPARFQRLRATIVTPRQTLQQVLDPPQTNIKTEPYTIGGVDQTQPNLALVTPGQVTSGRYFSAAGGTEALVGTTYAKSHSLKPGSTLDLNGTTFTVVGLVQPPLGGQTSDVYLPLAQLQKLANLAGQANVALVRAQGSASVANVQRSIEKTLPGSQVASAKQVADRINGSLVDASNLSHDLGLALSVIAAAAAFLIAALLTLSSVGKRVRELGTLKALGWTQRLVVRQVVGESLAQGIAGGVLGLAAGAAAAAVVSVYGPTLTASSSAGGGGSLFGLGEITRTATRHVALTAPLTIGILLLGLGLAVLGGLLAGSTGALRAARLRPADALRQLE